MNKTIQKDGIQTLEITNFNGALTRIKNGKLNSGLAKFDTSWGYNPFIKPGQLTWFRNPTNLGNLGATGLFVAGTSRIESGTLQNYILTSAGEIYKVMAEGASGSAIVTLSSGTPTFTYGGDITFYGATDTLYVAHDKGVTKVKTDGSGEAVVGTWDSTHFTAITTKRSLVNFNGLLYVTNSDASVTYANNIAEIALGGTVNSYAKLSPSLPVGSYIRDLDINPDFTYMLITASFTPSELLAPVNDGGNTGSSSSDLYKWNGSDTGVTSGQALPSFSVTALNSFSDQQMMFMYDTFGASLYSNGKKAVTMRNNKSPFPAAVCSTGNFISWTSPDVYLNLDTSAYGMFGSLYYYGNLDDDSNSRISKNLYRMFRQTSALGGVIYQMPYNQFTTNRYVGVNTTPTISEKSNGVHMFSFTDYSGSGGSTTPNLWIFYSSPPDINNSPVFGVYETQNELFSKRISVGEIRVYTEPTVTGNGFQIDLIGGDGKKVTNGTFNYTYSAGTDMTKAQGALERINFNVGTINLYSLGVRLTNTGTSNMAINKIEIDISSGGK